MSLLREAERCLANQHAHNLNAFITPLSRSGKWLDRVKEADQRSEKGTPKSAIDGRLISIKDNICTRQLPTTCASGILDKFTSPFNATVVERLEGAGAVIAGKTNLDEFGMGSHSVHSRFGPVKNLRRDSAGHEISAGGSSGGSAVAVAAEQCYAAIGTDTGGSVRLPAAYTGTVGFKPSYGLISRWGVVAYANSLDTVGILGTNTSTVRDIFCKNALPALLCSTLDDMKSELDQLTHFQAILNHHDPRDPTIRTAWLLSLAHLQKQGHTIHPISLPTTKHALSAYYVLAPAEASSNLAKYDGVRYGTRGDGPDGNGQPDGVLYSNTRGVGFGSEVQRRILLGTFSLSADSMDNYFIQAQRVRRLVQRDFNAVFSVQHPLFDVQAVQSDSVGAGAGTGAGAEVDVIVCPTAPSSPPRLSDLTGDSGQSSPLDAYVNDVFTVPASLAGLPAISVPVTVAESSRDSGADELAGIQVVGQYGDDELVMSVGELLAGNRLGEQ
ncbi:Amidase [Penicillium waksmanii]|uniref:Amidase n=1 Tax=Penicillium waksmanii TaxID=69791 RepID=UPI002548731C|nr:Amidase [Penicillium waksmanii]KAJ5975163.1 Amidase [Penicillium waksmanii]